MSKITIPILSYQNVASIYKLVDDLSNLNSEVLRTIVGDNLIIDFSSVIKPENQLQADQSVILSIIENGGQIENYLFGIRQPSASGALDVPAGVPSREFIYPPDSIRSFSQWFSKNASVWLNNVSDEFIYYNSPNPSDSIILTATESEIIRQLNTLYYSFLTVKEVLLITEDPNWIKL